jgi:hypothetical protein
MNVKTIWVVTGWLTVFLGTIAFIVVLQCARLDRIRQDELRILTNYVGTASCAQCHQPIYDQYRRTHHFLTTHFPLQNPVMQQVKQERQIFSPPETLSEFYIKRLAKNTVVMEEHKVGWRGHSEVESYPIDLVLGSGKIGYTFLYWFDNDLWRMPIGYSLNAWSFEPGLDREDITFDLQVGVSAQCLECHMTMIPGLATATLRNSAHGGNPVPFPQKEVLNIGCEKCHGPGRLHVAFQQGQTPVGVEDSILNPAALDRRGKLQLCAQCHAGLGTLKGTPYTYLPGNDLKGYFTIDPQEGEDVHVSHAIRFEQSPCFQRSENLHCWTCHSPHENKRNDVAYYSSICLRCHEDAISHHSLNSNAPASWKNNCIDCHMPIQESQLLDIRMSNGSLKHPRIRNHRIGIYPSFSQ